MKLIASLILLTFLLIPAYAQPSKGSVLIGSSFSFQSGYEDYSNSGATARFRTTSWDLQPSAGYFFLNRLCAGLAIPYSHTTNTGPSTPTTRSHSVGLGPFARYYLPLGDGFYGVMLASYQWRRDRFEDVSLEDFPLYGVFATTVTKQTLSFGAGLDYFVNKNIGIELMATYATDLSGYKDDQTEIDTNRLNISLGLQFYLNRKEE